MTYFFYHLQHVECEEETTEVPGEKSFSQSIRNLVQRYSF